MEIDECPSSAPASKPERRYIGTVYAMAGLDQQPKFFFHNWVNICLWNVRNIEADYARSAPEFDWRIHLPISGWRYNDHQREDAVDQCEGNWLCYLDTDMLFDESVVGQLLVSMQTIEREHGACDIITGLYTNREPSRLPIIYRYMPERDLWTNVLEFPRDRPFRVDGAGGGCLLIKRRVFDVVRERFGKAFDMLLHYRTEDLCFFRRVYEIGLQVWCDPRIQAGHAVTDFCWPRDFVGERVETAVEKAERQGDLYRAVPDWTWLSLDQAAWLTGRPHEELTAAVINERVSSKRTGNVVSVELESLLRWHKRGGT